MAIERKILLTGVTGQVGHELYHCLQHLGTVVPTIAQGEVFAGKALVMDLADASSIAAVINDVRPDLIVNPAAYTAVDKAEEQVALSDQVNAVAPGLLAEAAKKHDAALVQFSTDYVYPGTGTAAYSEGDPTGPLSQYGRSKLAGDLAVEAVGGSYLILRTSWVYGIHGHNFVKTMLKLGAERETLKIVQDQIGSPTSARTLADITAMILAGAAREGGTLSDALRDRRGVYHATNSGVTSWWDFATRIFELARSQGHSLKVREVLPIKSVEYPTPAQRPLNSRLSLAKLERVFGLKPAGWDAALAWALPAIIKAL